MLTIKQPANNPTGANSGVGYATTKVLTGFSSAYHVIMAGRSLSKLQTAKTELETSNNIKGSLSTLQLDVTDETSITNAAKQVQQQHSHIDALINNAGIGNGDPDLKTRFSLTYNTNVIGPVLVSEAFRPLLLNSPNPYSIYISSVVGSMTQITDNLDFSNLPKTITSRPKENAYRSSKAALNMVAIIEARDYASEGLKVFTMCPGFVVSNLRGGKDEQRNGWGHARDPEESGETVLGILEGRRDGNVGRFVHKDGIYPW